VAWIGLSWAVCNGRQHPRVLDRRATLTRGCGRAGGWHTRRAVLRRRDGRDTRPA
jgi:hypothetical protein